MTYSESPVSQLSDEIWHVFGGRRRFPTTRAQQHLVQPHGQAGLDLSFAGSQGEYHCMWRCPRPGLNPSGLVNISSLAAGPQFTEMKIL